MIVIPLFKIFVSQLVLLTFQSNYSQMEFTFIILIYFFFLLNNLPTLSSLTEIERNFITYLHIYITPSSVTKSIFLLTQFSQIRGRQIYFRNINLSFAFKFSHAFLSNLKLKDINIPFKNALIAPSLARYFLSQIICR